MANAARNFRLTPAVNRLLLLGYLGFVATLPARADLAADENPPTVSTDAPEEPVGRSVVEEMPETPRTVQIPVFEKGRWKGYREEPLQPERVPASGEEPPPPPASATP